MECKLTTVETEIFLTLGAHPFMQFGSLILNAVTATRQHSHVHLVTTDTQLRSRAPLVWGSGSGFNIQKQQVLGIHCVSVLSVVTRVDVIQQVVKLPLVSELCIIVCSNHGGCRDRSQGRPCPRPEGEFVYYLE